MTSALALLRTAAIEDLASLLALAGVVVLFLVA